MSERAIKAGGENVATLNTLGAAQFRTGNPRAAIDTLLRGAALGGGVTAWDACFLAMSLHTLGLEALAKDYLSNAQRWIDRHTELTKEELREVGSLRREAESVLAKLPKPPAEAR